ASPVAAGGPQTGERGLPAGAVCPPRAQILRAPRLRSVKAAFWSSLRSSCSSCMPKTAGAPVGFVKPLSPGQLGLHHRRNHELSDPISCRNPTFLAAQVHNNDVDLTPVVAVNSTGSIEHGQT